MKLKWMGLLLCIAMILFVVGCNTTNDEKTPTSEPQITEPEVTEPEVTEPEVTEPEVTEPEVTEPEVTEPEVTEPEVTEPEVTEPEVTEPEVTEPEVTEPEVTEPEVTEPEVTEPEVTEPEVTEPEVTESEVTEPEVTEPEVTEPEVTEPEVTEPEVTEPEVTEPEVTESEVTEPEVTEPEVTESEVTEPEVTEPEVTEPEVTEPEVTEPEVTEPEVTESEVTEPEVTEPEVTESEVTEPEVTEPEVTEPEVTEPEVTEPEVTEPEVTESEVTEPEVTEPEVTEPEVTEPEVTEPEVTEPEVTEPEITEPEVTEPEVIKTTADILTKTVYLFEGDSFRLNYVAKDEDLEVDWQVSTDCAEVRDNKVYAIKEGYAVISAGEDSVCSVKILPKTMPELYVATYGKKITSKEDYVTCDVTMLNTNEDFSFEYVPAGIRLRGNSTATQPKKPYRIKFESKINLLGMNDGAECKSWVLLAEWFDDSLIRNTTALSLAGSILEEYSSDWRYVKLILNGEDKGVYVLAEQSQINKYRVNIEEAGADTDALRSGYFYEVEGSKVDEGKFFISYENLGITTFLGNPYNVQSTDVQTDGQRRWGYFLELKNDDTSAEQIAFAEKYAQNIFTLIYSATYKNICYVMDENLNLVQRDDLTPEEAISMAVDIDSMARMYIYLEMVCNFDAFKKSSYFYVDFSEDGTGKLTFACPWDHDRAFVKNWDAIEHVDVDKYFTAERSVLYVMMMNHEWFRAKVGDVWEEVAVNSRGFQNTLDILEQLCDVYADDFDMETELWERENAQRSWAMATYDWLKVRIEWLDEQFMAMKQS